MTPRKPGPDGHFPSSQHGQLASPAPPGIAPSRPRSGPATGRKTPPTREASPVFRAPWQRSRSDFRRIRRDVIALALLVIVLAIGVVVQSSLDDREHRLSDATSHASDMARTVEQHVARLIDSNGQFLYDLRTHVEAEGGVDAIAPERLQFLLSSRRLYDEATRRVFVANAEGVRTAVVTGAAGIPPSVAQRAYFERHRASRDRGIAVDAPFPADGANDWVLPISVRLDRPDGSFGGVAVLSFDIDYLDRYFRSRALGLRPGGSVALVGEDGRFMVRYPEFPDAPGAHRVNRARPFPAAQGVIEAVSPADGKLRLVAFHKVAGYPLYATVTVERDEVMQAWMRSSLLRVALGGAVIGVVALFTVLLLARLDAERLAQAELARFEQAMDQAGDLVYWISQDGRIVYLNATAARRYAADSGAMPHVLTLHDIAAHHSPAGWKGFWEELARRGTMRFEAEHLSHDGHAYPVEVAASHQELEGAGYALFIVRERQAA